MASRNLNDLFTLTARGPVQHRIPCPGARCSVLHAASQNRDSAKPSASGTRSRLKRKIPPRGGTFLLTHCSPSISSELAVPLALLTLAALAVRILLLLAGLLAAALLLAGLLTRVLILLARILVLVGHSGSPYLRCNGKCNGKTTAKAQVWFPKKLRFPRDHCVAQICPECGVGTGQTTGRDQQKWEPVLRPIAP